MKISKSRFAGIAAFAAILYAPLTKPALDPNTSAIGRGFSLTGVMTFDGKGRYTFAGQMLDTHKGRLLGCLQRLCADSKSD